MKKSLTLCLIGLLVGLPSLLFSGQGMGPGPGDRSHSGGGAITKVQSVTSFTSGTTNSKAITGVVAGNLITVQLGFYQQSTSLLADVTDSASTPTICNGTTIVPSTGGALIGSNIWFVPNASSGTHTFGQALTTGGDVLMTVTEWSGFPTSGLLDTAPTGGSNNTNGVATIGTGTTATLAQTNELALIGMTTSNNGPGNTTTDITNPPSGWTTLNSNVNTVLTIGLQHSFKTPGATTALSAAWTWTNDSSTNGAVGTICTLKGF